MTLDRESQTAGVYEDCRRSDSCGDHGNFAVGDLSATGCQRAEGGLVCRPDYFGSFDLRGVL